MTKPKRLLQEYLLLEAKTAQQKIASNFFGEKIPLKLLQQRHATLLETFDSLLSKTKLHEQRSYKKSSFTNQDGGNKSN